jgi:hypothetical protein
VNALGLFIVLYCNTTTSIEIKSMRTRKAAVTDISASGGYQIITMFEHLVQRQI